MLGPGHDKTKLFFCKNHLLLWINYRSKQKSDVVLEKEEIGSKNVKFQLYHLIQCKAAYPTIWMSMKRMKWNAMKMVPYRTCHQQRKGVQCSTSTSTGMIKLKYIKKKTNINAWLYHINTRNYVEFPCEQNVK